MKTLLLLGGMTPDVTTLYYNKINSVTRSTRGGRASAPLHLYSADLELMIGYATSGRWSDFASCYIDAINALARFGQDSVEPNNSRKRQIDGVVICAILAHKVSGLLENVLGSYGIPLLHIADILTTHLKAKHPDVETLGLIGPKITMLDVDDTNFFVGRLQDPNNGYKVLTPSTSDGIEEVNRGMIEEVAKGRDHVSEATKAMFIREAQSLIRRGAQAIILGSTDLGFILGQEDIGKGVLLIDPATLHAEEVALWALRE